ncbi:unnamed protein product [Paramecium pentaurelia]|uniref:Uncharacterized protein n=1 Tax=Paramecium pentaurelia TaxID=43138 RepID=A0A8S1TQL1_9CILI|nr:unnamed protein product [Paramecium pentaurelia]
MKPRNYSFKQETTQSEFANLMTKQQIQNRFTHISKQPLTRSTSRTHSLYVKQTQIQNMCTIFEKLINKSNQSKPLKQKYQNICSDFGIDFNILQQFTKLEEKQNYIIRCTVDEISNQFDRIIQKYDSTKSNIQNIDDKLDLYGWLKVKSQYKAILKRLKFALVQMIQNSPRVFFEKQCNNDNSELNNINSQTKFNLKNFDIQQPDVFFEWNKAVEAQFISMKKNYIQKGYETMKKQLANGTQTSKRGIILDKCEQTGNYITKEELQYIASTSFLINKNVDKEFIQRAINSLQNEIKQQIELNISEQILQDYYTLKENQMKKRQQYFEEQNIIKRKQIADKTINYKKKQYLSKDSLQMKVVKSKFVQYLIQAQKKKFIKEAIEIKKQSILRRLQKSGNPLANIYVQKFKEIMQNVVKRYRQKKGNQIVSQQNFFERNAQKQMIKPLFIKDGEEMPLEQVKHKFHPPSKLLISAQEDKHNQIQKEKLIKQSQNFRLAIRNYNIQKSEFLQFYSGGPQSRRRFQSQQLKFMNQIESKELPIQQGWVSEEIEIQAANKIKMAIKRYLYKKKVSNILGQKAVLKNRDIEIKIQKCLKAKRFFEELSHELSKRQTEKLKDLSIFSPPKLPLDQIQKSIFIPYSTPSSPQTQRLSQQKTLDISLASSRIVKQSLHQKQELKNESLKQSLINKVTKIRISGETKIKSRKLIQAAKMKSVTIAESAGFIYVKADTEQYDQYGNTPLYYSAKFGDINMTKLLLKAGADVNQKCSNDNTPLHMAFQSGNKQIIIDFLNKGGDLNLINKDNCTPLAFGSLDLLKSLNLQDYIATINPNLQRRTDNQQLLHQKIIPQNYQSDDELLLELKMRI